MGATQPLCAGAAKADPMPRRGAEGSLGAVKMSREGIFGSRPAHRMDAPGADCDM
jgi:hypothetical protein